FDALFGSGTTRGTGIRAASQCALCTVSLDFVLPSDVFIHTNGQIFDNLIHDAQPALGLLDNVARCENRQQDVKAVPELVYGISKATLPHLFDLGNRSAAGGNDAFDLGIDLVDFLFNHIRVDDEHDFVITHL